MMVELQSLRKTRRKEGEGRLPHVSVGARIRKITETHPLQLQRARGQHFVDEGAVRAKPVLEDPATCLVGIVLDRLGVLTLLTSAVIHVAHSSHKALSGQNVFCCGSPDMSYIRLSQLFVGKA